MSETKELPLYLAQDGLTGRDGGPYLDQIEREQAEKRRAVVEDREPDLEHPPATAGTVLVTGAQLIAAADVNVPSRQQVNPVGDAIKAIVDDSDFPVSVHSTIEVDDLSRKPEYDPADPTVTPFKDAQGNDINDAPEPVNEDSGEVVNNDGGENADGPVTDEGDNENPEFPEPVQNDVPTFN